MAHHALTIPAAVATLAIAMALGEGPWWTAANAALPNLAGSDVAAARPHFELAQATVPPTGMEDAEHPMPMADRMQRRFPQPVRVGDLIGLPMLDDSESTIGVVRQVVRTPQDKIKLIVSFGGWFGWGARPVAVPIEAVGIMGRELSSLDMPPSEYKTAPTWQGTDATVLPADATIRVALARR